MTPPSRPPRLARLLVRARRLGEHRAEVEGDMLELYRERWADRGGWYARYRYWRDAISVWLHAIPTRASWQPAIETRRLRAHLSSDARWAWRSMRARSGASLAVIVVLSLGIGLAAAMFALADPYVLRPLPYPQPDELVIISPPNPLRLPMAPPDNTTLADWQARTDVFAAVAAFDSGESIQIQEQDRLTSLRAVPVSASFFRLLGLQVPAGADWRITPGQVERPMVVIDEAIGTIGASVRSPDGRQWRIAGRLPRTFVFPHVGSAERVTALTPIADEHVHRVWTTPGSTMTSSGVLHLIGRLRKGVSSDAANNALSPATEVERTRPPGPPARMVEGLTTAMTRKARALAWGAAIAGLLIFLACAANIANLLMTRGAYRVREFATRQALGATGLDLARLVLVELACLTTAAVVAGLALAAAALKVMNGVMPAGYTAMGAPAITARVATFAALNGCLVMIVGLVPASVAWHVKATPLFDQMQPAESLRIRAMRFAMTASQLTVAMILLAGGALLIRSYARLVNQDIGFSPDAFVVTVMYPGDREVFLLEDIGNTIARLRLVPGIHDPAAVRGPLADEVTSIGTSIVNGRLLARAGGKEVTPSYAAATGNILVAGRFFTPEDGQHARVVNQAFARLCCPDQSAIGAVVTIDVGRQATIVGVLKDAFDSAMDKPPSPLMLSPLTSSHVTRGSTSVHYVFRTEGSDCAFLPTVERQILGVNPSGVVSEASTLGDRLSHTVRDRSFATSVVVLFSITGLIVSATGLVGVVGFSVARRTREIAIRVALGAPTSHVRWLVAREASVAASVGVLCGLLGGTWLSGTLIHLLYGIQPLDMVSFASAMVVMIIAVAVAAAIPAGRALRITPTNALRSE